VRDVVIVDVMRTPSGRGKAGGALQQVHPVDLLGGLLYELGRRTAIDPGMVDDVIGGCVTQYGEQSSNVTRAAVLAAGWPVTVPATTVDRQCGSSQQAIAFAAQAIQSGSVDVVIACGVESMSRIPMPSNSAGADLLGRRLRARYPEGLVGQGVSSEMVTARWKLTRSDLDEFAADSHRKAATATSVGAFAPDLHIVDEAPALLTDETIRHATTSESLSHLPPAFRTEEDAARFTDLTWQTTAGNSSPLSDGAAGVLLMSGTRASELGLRPRARVHTSVVTGADPVLMLMGVVPATQLALSRAGLTLEDIDLFEVNEAFASVPLAWLAETHADPSRLNVHGGAIALGHPLGASGARLMTTLVGAMEQHKARYGLQTMCEAGGMANATIIERL
jgi:acetyl-CoA acyltransferase